MPSSTNKNLNPFFSVLVPEENSNEKKSLQDEEEKNQK
jgi:hypothetical protein